ncbi:hypothetical protein J3A83DRAFT_4189047 [Scleroderma citrinum]
MSNGDKHEVKDHNLSRHKAHSWSIFGIAMLSLLGDGWQGEMVEERDHKSLGGDYNQQAHWYHKACKVLAKGVNQLVDRVEDGRERPEGSISSLYPYGIKKFHTLRDSPVYHKLTYGGYTYDALEVVCTMKIHPPVGVAEETWLTVNELTELVTTSIEPDDNDGGENVQMCIRSTTRVQAGDVDALSGHANAVKRPGGCTEHVEWCRDDHIHVTEPYRWCCVRVWASWGCERARSHGSHTDGSRRYTQQAVTTSTRCESKQRCWLEILTCVAHPSSPKSVCTGPLYNDSNVEDSNPNLQISIEWKRGRRLASAEQHGRTLHAQFCMGPIYWTNLVTGKKTDFNEYAHMPKE